MAFDLPGVMQNSDEETLFKAVGFVVVQFGCAEQVLDMLTFIIFPKSKKPPKKQPVLLTAKTQFIRDNMDCHPILQQLKIEIDALLTRFEKVGEKRNDIVHGAITSLSLENGSFKFAKMDIVKGDVPTIRPVHLDDAEFSNLRTELLSLGADAIILVKRAMDIVKVQP
jgi:hypothetical protein